MWNHHVVLTGLKENTRYFYRCGDPIAGWSTEYHFQVNQRINSTRIGCVILLISVISLMSVCRHLHLLQHLREQLSIQQLLFMVIWGLLHHKILLLVLLNLHKLLESISFIMLETSGFSSSHPLVASLFQTNSLKRLFLVISYADDYPGGMYEVLLITFMMFGIKLRL